MSDALEVRELTIDVDRRRLPGTLALPGDPRGLVLFAHGSGSSRLSPRNQHVAAVLRDRGFGTFLFDLLDPLEADDRRLVFDVGLLSRRLLAATERMRAERSLAPLPFGYFGASTGAAAALIAAAEGGETVRAVVSRGGRPDLAIGSLRRVLAATLLIVGGLDLQVLPLNRTALDQLVCEKWLSVVPGATHLFEEPGALEEVARLGADWFEAHLSAPAARGQSTASSQGP